MDKRRLEKTIQFFKRNDGLRKDTERSRLPSELSCTCLSDNRSVLRLIRPASRAKLLIPAPSPKFLL